jgi:hypothetical protein
MNLAFVLERKTVTFCVLLASTLAFFATSSAPGLTQPARQEKDVPLTPSRQKRVAAADLLDKEAAELAKKGNLPAAIERVKQSLKERQAALPAGDVRIALGQQTLAALLLRQGAYTEAEAALSD